MSRHVDAGSKVMLGMDSELSSAVVRLFDPEQLQVRVDVPLADVGEIGVGMPTEVVVSVLPQRTFTGRVTRVVHEADVTRNTLQVKVSIDDPVPSLKPEMLARVKFFQPANPSDDAAGGTRPALFAPASVIMGEGDQAAAWVVDVEQGVAQRRSLTLGSRREGDWVEVVSGLMPGDRLIVDASGLQEGERIHVVGESDESDQAGGSNGVR